MGKVIRWVVGIILGLLAVLLLWGGLIEPYLIDVEEETAVIPNLPSEWQGRRVGVIADFQIGMWGDNETTVSKAVDRLLEIRPDVVLVLGDFVYHAPKGSENDVQTAAQMLMPLIEANIPTYAVLGNHDYQVNKVGENPNVPLAQRLEEALEAVGVLVLHDEAVELPGGSGGDSKLFLVGIDAYQPQLSDPARALSELSESDARLVMMHNPASFGAIPAGAAPLAVAGHTHGGQIRIPLAPEWTYLTYLESEPVHADGWIHGYGKPENRLYVNRGIGFSLIPIRINCMPEVTIFTLQRP